MPHETPVYDLTLLISTAIPEEARATILADVEAAIERESGSLVGRSDWGTRNLAYRIQHQEDAEFHLLQMTGPPSLLESLGHSLRITDSVLRFRIIKAIPGARVGTDGDRGREPAPAASDAPPEAAAPPAAASQAAPS